MPWLRALPFVAQFANINSDFNQKFRASLVGNPEGTGGLIKALEFDGGPTAAWEQGDSCAGFGLCEDEYFGSSQSMQSVLMQLEEASLLQTGESSFIERMSGMSGSNHAFGSTFGSAFGSLFDSTLTSGSGTDNGGSDGNGIGGSDGNGIGGSDGTGNVTGNPLLPTSYMEEGRKKEGMEEGTQEGMTGRSEAASDLSTLTASGELEASALPREDTAVQRRVIAAAM
jgi:hypothetical protein